MDVTALDYTLPSELIAQAPLPERDAARLLCVARHGTRLAHRCVRDLPALLPPALIVLNDTKVLPARLFAHKQSGGKVEFLLVERLAHAGPSERWLALGQTRKGLRAGMQLQTAGGELALTVLELRGQGELVVELAVASGATVEQALAVVGQLPLPPYIRRAPDASDAERYQTVFAARPGAVAAPTAGLHVSQALIAALRAYGHELAFVTLHVGLGTFAPLKAANLAEHRMHSERFEVPAQTARAIAAAKAQGRPVLAVGTTVVRSLEAAASATGRVEPQAGDTSLLIYPPYEFRVIDALLTNFHLPRSTLLALVMAFAGEATTRAAYEEAVAQRYRFFSYGDAMLIAPGLR